MWLRGRLPSVCEKGLEVCGEMGAKEKGCRQEGRCGSGLGDTWQPSELRVVHVEEQTSASRRARKLRQREAPCTDVRGMASAEQSREGGRGSEQDLSWSATLPPLFTLHAGDQPDASDLGQRHLGT